MSSCQDRWSFSASRVLCFFLFPISRLQCEETSLSSLNRPEHPVSHSLILKAETLRITNPNNDPSTAWSPAAVYPSRLGAAFCLSSHKIVALAGSGLPILEVLKIRGENTPVPRTVQSRGTAETAKQVTHHLQASPAGTINSSSAQSLIPHGILLGLGRQSRPIHIINANLHHKSLNRP